MYSDQLSSNKLALYRRRMGFSQKQVSHLLGHCDASMLSRYEHGRSLPPLPTALSLEIVLRTPVAFLFPAFYDERKRQIREEEGRLGSKPEQMQLL